MADTLEGTCLCGGVEYEVLIPRQWATATAAAASDWTGSSLAGVVVAKENFQFTKGEDLVKTYESEFAPRNFCSNCGSSIFDDLGEVYFVAAGLMGDLDMEPSFHQLVAYKAAGTDRRRRAAVRRAAAGLARSAPNSQLVSHPAETGIRSARHECGPSPEVR